MGEQFYTRFPSFSPLHPPISAISIQYFQIVINFMQKKKVCDTNQFPKYLLFYQPRCVMYKEIAGTDCDSSWNSEMKRIFFLSLERKFIQ